jgi:hypothetical protein
VSRGVSEPETPAHARALAAFFRDVSPRLLHELADAGALGDLSEAKALYEFQAAALHACIRGVVAADEQSDAKADLVDALHDLLLPALAPEAEQPALRAHLAKRYGEYDGLSRTHGQRDASGVPAAIATRCARHLHLEPATAFVHAATPLLEALAEGAAALLAEPGTPALAEPGAPAHTEPAAPGLRLPSIPPLRALTSRLDEAGIAWAVGASGLLASLGLVDEVNDWDVQVDVDPDGVRALFADLVYEFHGHGGCHADWKLAFAEARTELIPRFAFFVPGGVVRVPLAVSGHWRGLPIASPEGWACAYWLMGEYDEPSLRARRADRAERLFAHLEREGADRGRTEAMLAEPLPERLAARLRALLAR